MKNCLLIKHWFEEYHLQNKQLKIKIRILRKNCKVNNYNN